MSLKTADSDLDASQTVSIINFQAINAENGRNNLYISKVKPKYGSKEKWVVKILSSFTKVPLCQNKRRFLNELHIYKLW